MKTFMCDGWVTRVLNVHVFALVPSGGSSRWGSKHRAHWWYTHTALLDYCLVYVDKPQQLIIRDLGLRSPLLPSATQPRSDLSPRVPQPLPHKHNTCRSDCPCCGGDDRKDKVGHVTKPLSLSLNAGRKLTAHYDKGFVTIYHVLTWHLTWMSSCRVYMYITPTFCLKVTDTGISH